MFEYIDGIDTHLRHNAGLAMPDSAAKTNELSEVNTFVCFLYLGLCDIRNKYAIL